MKNGKKARINLYVNQELINFAKQWSYVTNIPISKMVEEYLQHQKNIVTRITPFQWLSDQEITSNTPAEEKYLKDLDEYINNLDEEKFCSQNPDHPRAKMRQKLLREHEELYEKSREKQRKEKTELIKRWMEIFSLEPDDRGTSG